MTTRRGLTRRASLAAALITAIVGGPAATSASEPVRSPPPVGHVFVMVLENEDAEVSFGEDSPAPYLARELPAQGQMLSQYFGIGHASLGNYIAMISGQAPNPTSQSDCLVFEEFVSTASVLDVDGQAVGVGCVLPSDVVTVADQLETAGLTWRGYMEGMGAPCRHPAVGAVDTTQAAEVGDQYATRHNPFMYFHSIIDDDASCREHVVDLDALTSDLARESSTPNVSFITPDLCHDGHDAPCVDGQPGGLVSADAFLKAWVPEILASPAYRHDGLLVIAFDEGAGDDPASAAACCGEVPGPNSAVPGRTGPGGGRVGAVVLSPFVEPGSVNTTPYNHYALLRSIEDIFGLPYLGFAGADGLRAFGPDVFGRSIDGSTSSTVATAPTGSSGLDPEAGAPPTPLAPDDGPSVPRLVLVGVLGALVGLVIAHRFRRDG